MTKEILMRRSRTPWLASLTWVLLGFVARPIGAQVADTDVFRKHLEDVPQLPMDRIELRVDPSVDLEMISAVTSDEDGNIYLVHRKRDADPVVVLDSTGRFLRSWGKGMFTIPHGIRIDPAGNVWTIDANTSKVYKFAPEGNLLLEIDIDRPESERDFCGATDVSFLTDGRVVVADGYCNGRVVELDGGGGQLREWGNRGTEPGQFVVAHSVAVGPDGIVYVADRENGRLQRFDADGRFLGLWDYARQLFSVAFGPTGELYISVVLSRDPLEGYLIRIDPATGDMLGRVDDVMGHELAVSKDGSLLPGALSEVLLFRPRD